MKNLRTLVLVLAAGGSLAACQDLNVPNPNAPALTESLATPLNVETTVGSAFKYWHAQTLDQDLRQAVSVWHTIALAGNADEVTDMVGDAFFDNVAMEPKQAVDHTGAGFWFNRTPWLNFHAAIASCRDVIDVLDAGMKLGAISEDFPNGANTDRARWMCWFVMGASHAYISTLFDRGFTISPGLDPDGPACQATDLKGPGCLYDNDFKTPAEVHAHGIAQIEKAIEIAKASRPDDATHLLWINNTAYTRDEFILVMYSYLARIRAMRARNVTERAAVDWTKVISDIDNGIQDGFKPVTNNPLAGRSALCPVSGTTCGGAFVWQSDRTIRGTPNNYRSLVSQFTGSGGPRIAQRFLGPGDTSGAYQWWESVNIGSRRDTIYASPDRRIQLTTPTSAGRYFSRGGTPASNLGPTVWSRYLFSRFSASSSAYRDSINTSLTRTEMDLLKAEALIRLNRAAEAVPLINKTRVGVRCIADVNGPVSTAGTFIVGQRYAIVTVGTTNWVAIGAASNTVGVVFTATGVGSGTGTAARQVPCNSVANPVATNEAGTYGGNLPAVDVNGPPQSTAAERASCVPKRRDGTCGNLFDALMWEKRLESVGIDPHINWSDWRAWGKFAPGTWLAMPIHSRELYTLGIPYYTFGGSQPGSVGATPNPSDKFGASVTYTTCYLQTLPTCS